jgi:hypothetical protein
MKNYMKICMLIVLICSDVGVYADRPTIGVMDIPAKGLSSEDAAKNPDFHEKSGNATRRLLQALVLPVGLAVLALTITIVLVIQAI